MSDSTPKQIFISVAEDSADVHAAALVRAARERLPGCSFHGLTGPRLRALGVETVFDMTAHAAMLSGVLRVIGKAWRALKAIEESWRRRRPDLVVLLDSPTLHLRIAKKARAAGISVLYYIAPQTWASRERRNRQIARDISRLACILPFEPAYFHSRDVPQAEFVGHPLFESLQREQPDEAVIERLRGGEAPLIAVLPGSRGHVIETMLPLQLRVLAHLRAMGVPFRAAVSAVDEKRREIVARILDDWTQRNRATRESEAATASPATLSHNAIEIVTADNASLLTAADLVLVASGTATLHVGHYRKPMIVMYDAGRLLRLPYRLFGRRIVRTPHLSLVNILAGARVVPEFMPFIGDTRPIARVAEQLLGDTAWRALMVEQIDAVVAPLEASRASVRVCEMMDGLLHGSPTNS